MIKKNNQQTLRKNTNVEKIRYTNSNPKMKLIF